MNTTTEQLQTNKITYNVDMVFCIDATASMGNIIDIVKQNAMNLYDDVVETMRKKQKILSGMRIRVVAFRDYIADKENAMMVTNFFELPAQAAEFRDCVMSIKAKGGGDDPEDGLEALAYAMRSDWDTEGMRKRHVIVVWTDAPTHEIGYGKAESNYPANMPKDFAELTSWWGAEQMPGQMNESAKRLLMFAPEATYWSNIADAWNNSIHFPSQAGQGLQELDYQQILDTIVNTI